MGTHDRDPSFPDPPNPTGSEEDLVPTEIVARPTSGASGSATREAEPASPDERSPRPQRRNDPAEPAAREPRATRETSPPTEVPDEADPHVGRWIGPYRLVRLLGRGGMGRVYLAEQEEPLHRQVALKIVRAALQGPAARARFEAEQKALARMSHPFVAQVFDSGTTTDGEPWFVMERVEGQDIAGFCDERHLDVGARLRLFLDVCAGVEHAHQKAILHRDLKPSNILVSEVAGRPVPKVIDFGVAKALDGTGADDTLLSERFVGTRGYLSPEAVVRGKDQDTRSDVYLLGLVLYELLVGTPAYPRDEDSLLEHVQRIARGDVPPLPERWDGLDPDEQEERAALRRASSRAAHRQRLAGDLRWIVERALAREKEDRYPSAAALAEDVQRHLDDRPIEAGPPRTLDRITKLVRRHRVAVVAGSLVVLSLAGGFVARTLEAQRANREAARAVEAAERAAREAATAEAVTDFLIDLFETNEPDRERGDQVTARELLDRGAERIRGALTEEPVTRAAILDTIGSLLNSLGAPDEAEALIVEGLELRRAHLPPDAPEIAESLVHLTMMRTESGRFDAAEESARELVEMRERTGAPPALLADALNQRSINLHNLGRYEESEEWQRRSLRLLEENALFDDDAWHIALNHLGALQLDTGRFAEAVGTLERAREARERIVGTDSDSVGQTLNNLGLAFAQLGRHHEAIEVVERALEIRERRLGPDHPNLAWSLRLLALSRLETGDLDGAERDATRSLRLREGALGRRHPFTALSLEALAHVRRRQGRLDEAEALVRETLGIAEESLEPGHMAWGYYLHALANVLRDGGRFEEAREAYGSALERMRGALGPDHPDVEEVEADRERSELLSGSAPDGLGRSPQSGA